jgi:cytochrome P450
MTAPEPNLLRQLHDRAVAEGPVFWINDTDLAVFDPDLAGRINTANFAEFTLNDKLSDMLRGRTSEPVDWRRVRAAWLAQLRTLNEPEHVAALGARMRDVLDARVGVELDLMRLGYEVAVRPLVPMVVADLTPREATVLSRDLIAKITTLVSVDGAALRNTPRSMLVQARAGAVVRRVLRGRASGRRPAHDDFVDPLARDLLLSLGIGRAVEAATAMLTAITGPPGSSAANLLYELSRQPRWRANLTAELEALDPDRLYRAPLTSAPVTLRFVKEVQRIWSPPLLLNRRVRGPVDVDGARLRPGQQYVVCPYLTHHDPNRWRRPDDFDPDRWLPAAPHGPTSGSDFVAFGWAPTSCIGAGIGTTQMVLLCHLICTRYRLTVDDPAAVRMALLAMPTPLNFHGRLELRRQTV